MVTKSLARMTSAHYLPKEFGIAFALLVTKVLQVSVEFGIGGDERLSCRRATRGIVGVKRSRRNGKVLVG